MNSNKPVKMYPPRILIETWLQLLESEDEVISRRAKEMLQTRVGTPKEIRAYLNVDRG